MATLFTHQLNLLFPVGEHGTRGKRPGWLDLTHQRRPHSHEYTQLMYKIHTSFLHVSFPIDMSSAGSATAKEVSSQPPLHMKLINFTLLKRFVCGTTMMMQS